MENQKRLTGRIHRESKLVRLPHLGKIKVGEKNDDTGIPRSLDYFIADGVYKSYFDEVFGEKPQSIPIMFFSDDPNDACRERYELREGKKLLAFGDGETFKVFDEKESDYIDYDMSRPDDEKYIKGLIKTHQKSKWTTTLTLFFIIPDIKQVFGQWSFSTRGVKSTIPEIVGTFDTLKQIAGTVQGIPMDLMVEKVTSQKPGSKSSFPVVKIVPNISFGHLEKVRKFLGDSREKFLGLLTEEKINGLGEVKQITMGGDDANTEE